MLANLNAQQGETSLFPICWASCLFPARTASPCQSHWHQLQKKKKNSFGWICYLYNHHLKVKKGVGMRSAGPLHDILWHCNGLCGVLCIIIYWELQTEDPASSWTLHSTLSKRWRKEQCWLSWHLWWTASPIPALHCEEPEQLLQLKTAASSEQRAALLLVIPQCNYKAVQLHSVKIIFSHTCNS